MSIINEALNKTQTRLINNSSSSSSSSNNTNPNSKSNYLFIASTLILITTLISLGYFGYAKLNKPRYINSHSKSRKHLALTGTMLMGNKRVALINHHTYKVGDKVKQQQVIAITPTKIYLMHKNTVKSISITD